MWMFGCADVPVLGPEILHLQLAVNLEVRPLWEKFVL